MQPNGGIKRTDLLTAQLGAHPPDRVEIKRVDLSPGQVVGLHRHPCPVVGYIAHGTIRFQIRGESARDLHAGDAFFEPQDTVIVSFDNGSDREPATFIAFYLLGAGGTRLIEML